MSTAQPGIQSKSMGGGSGSGIGAGGGGGGTAGAGIGGRKAELSSASGDLSISRRPLKSISIIAHQSTD